MSAEQQFLEPARREIAASEKQSRGRSVKAVTYVAIPSASVLC